MRDHVEVRHWGELTSVHSGKMGTYVLFPIGTYCGYESDGSWGLWSLVANPSLNRRIHTIAEIINW
jgi:hypothetical protein